MSEMVERVAQAISDADDPPKGMDPYPAIARAAIEAMREPNLAMVDAGFELAKSRMDEPLFLISTDAPYHIWHAMVDAALSE